MAQIQLSQTLLNKAGGIALSIINCHVIISSMTVIWIFFWLFFLLFLLSGMFKMFKTENAVNINAVCFFNVVKCLLGTSGHPRIQLNS